MYSDAWKPSYKNALDNEKEQERSEYVTKQTIDLDATPDLGPWNPSQTIRDLVPTFDDIQIVLIDRDTNLNEIKKIFTKSKTVGLTILGHAVSRNCLPLMICLSTDNVIYALDPTYEKGIKFLRLQMKNPALTFVVPVGLEESDCLYHNFGIDLTVSNADSCSAKHTRLMEVMRHLPDSCLQALYPNEAIRRCRQKLVVERFETVASIWLGVDKSELYYDAMQLNHLKTRPLSMTALNIIKKRCILVRCVYDTLSNYVWREFEAMNTTTKHMLDDLSEHVKSLALESAEDEVNSNIAGVSYYLHLDGYSRRKTR